MQPWKCFPVYVAGTRSSEEFVRDSKTQLEWFEYDYEQGLFDDAFKQALALDQNFYQEGMDILNFGERK